MKIKFLVVLFLVANVQNAEENKKTKTGSRMGKLVTLCALYCASVLSTDSQADATFDIRNVEAPQGGQCYFEGCYCPHDIITSGRPVPAYFYGTADDIYSKYCTNDRFHDKHVDQVPRLGKTMIFCQTLIQKVGSCLKKMTPPPQDPDFSKDDVVNEIIPLKVKDTSSTYSVDEKTVEDYLKDKSTPGIICEETGPESCNCSCTYRVFGKNSDGKRYMSDYETKETTGKLTDYLYKLSTESIDFKGARRTKNMTWNKSTLRELKREDL